MQLSGDVNVLLQQLPIFITTDASIIIAIAQISGLRRDHRLKLICLESLGQIWEFVDVQVAVKR